VKPQSSKKKIVLSSNTSWNLYNFCSGLIETLIANDYKVVILAPEDSFTKLLEKKGCEITNIKLSPKSTNPFREIKTIGDYCKIYRDLSPDLVMHFTIKPVIYGSISARFLNVPVINSITGLGVVFTNVSWVTSVVSFLYRFSMAKVNSVFFLNNDDRKLFIKKKLVKPEICSSVPGPGVNTEKFYPLPLPDPLEEFRFLFVGRLLWDKGVGELVSAAEKLKKKYPRIKVQFLGHLDVENPRAISREDFNKCTRNGTVEYLGSTDNVASYIAKAQCIVLPSYREGVPRCLLEAAAMARPLITTDTVGCKDAVDDEISGFLCRPRDAEDLADKMEKMFLLSTEQREEMGRFGREKIVREMDEKIVIAKYIDQIQNVLK